MHIKGKAKKNKNKEALFPRITGSKDGDRVWPSHVLVDQLNGHALFGKPKTKKNFWLDHRVCMWIVSVSIFSRQIRNVPPITAAFMVEKFLVYIVTE